MWRTGVIAAPRQSVKPVTGDNKDGRRIFLRMKRWIELVAAITVGAALSAASSRAENLKIGYGAFSLGYALIWVTQEGRVFEKNGLDAEVLYLESNLVRTALISGDIPVGAMSGAAMATPKLQGADLVVGPGIPESFAVSIRRAPGN